MRDFTLGPLPESDTFVRNQQREAQLETMRQSMLTTVRQVNRQRANESGRRTARRAIQPVTAPATRDNGATLKKHRDSVRSTVRKTRQGRNIDDIMNRQTEPGPDQTLVGYARGLLAAF